MLGEVPLNEVSGLFGGEAEEHVDSFDVPRVQTDWVRYFRVHVLLKEGKNYILGI